MTALATDLATEPPDFTEPMTLIAPDERDESTISVESEVELLALLAGDDPDPIAPGETPRFLYRGKADGESADLPVLDGAAVAAVVEAAIGTLAHRSESGTGYLAQLDELDARDRQDRLRVIGDLYGLDSGLLVMTCDPRVALYFAEHEPDGDEAGAGPASIQRVRLRDFHTHAARSDGQARLVDVHSVPRTVAERPAAQQALSLVGVSSEMRNAIRSDGGWHRFRFPQDPSTSYATPARMVTPKVDPMLDALAKVAERGKVPGATADVQPVIEQLRRALA